MYQAVMEASEMPTAAVEEVVSPVRDRRLRDALTAGGLGDAGRRCG
jgi:hypothetical protein